MDLPRAIGSFACFAFPIPNTATVFLIKPFVWWRSRCRQVAVVVYFSLVFTSDASTSANKRDDSSGNEIRRKHKHKQNHPNLPNCFTALGNLDPVFSLAKHNHVW